jgi:hypothetical protein
MIFLGIDKGFSAKTRPRHRVGCHRAVVERTNIAKEYAPLAMFGFVGNRSRYAARTDEFCFTLQSLYVH